MTAPTRQARRVVGGVIYTVSDDQHEIKRTARDLLARRSTFEKVRAAAEVRISALVALLGATGIFIRYPDANDAGPAGRRA